MDCEQCKFYNKDTLLVMNYRIVYDVIKEEVLPAAWDDSKKEYCKNRTVMKTLGNARIEWCGGNVTNENNNRS